ncbi:hypothetical protein ACS0TY_010749 [Phlomoides rotata]
MMCNLFGSNSDDESHSECINELFQNDGFYGDDQLEGPTSNDRFQKLNDSFQNEGMNEQENVQVEAPMSNADVNAQDNVHFEAPQKGMIYDNFDSIFNTYQEYARQTGFSVLKRVLKNNKYALMTCDKSRVSITQKSSKRIGCPTRKIDVHMKRLLEANDMADIGPSKNIRLCEVQAGGPDKIIFIPRDCRNFIDDRRRFRLGVGDAEVIPMGGVHPKAIITYQCESIKGAVRDGLAQYNRAVLEFKGIVYDIITISNFETRWADFLVKYGMQNNTWLQGLYDEKEKWVPVYLSHIFLAGMLSTQRSEGMHAYFDDYMHSRCSLKEFMEQYEVAIGKKIQKEFIADFESKNKVKKSPENDDDGVVEAVVQKFYVLDRSHRNNFRPEFTYKVEYRADGEYLNC